MCSRPFRPLGFAHLCRSRPGGSIHSLLPSQLCLDHSHCLVLAPATLAALPSTRAIEIDSCAPAHIDLPVFPSMSLASPRLHSFASHLTRRYPSRLCLLCRFPQKLHSFDRACSMSLFPFAPLYLAPARLDRYRRGVPGHVAHPSRSIARARDAGEDRVYGT
jgi:hypothetical protein